jgi:hypothetical protein
MFPVRYEKGFYIPEDGILHSHRREYLKSYIAVTGWALQRKLNVFPVRCGLRFYILEGGILHSRRQNLKSYIISMFFLSFCISIPHSPVIFYWKAWDISQEYIVSIIEIWNKRQAINQREEGSEATRLGQARASIKQGNKIKLNNKLTWRSIKESHQIKQNKKLTQSSIKQRHKIEHKTRS